MLIIMYEGILVQDIYSKIISFNRILKNSLSLGKNYGCKIFLEVSTKSFAKQLNIILHALNKRTYLKKYLFYYRAATPFVPYHTSSKQESSYMI